jgi:soluble lytic murein transglycosylase-like protein
VAMLLAFAPMARAAEHVTLANGFEFDCVRREPQGDKVRLFFASDAGTKQNYVDVAADAVVRVETVPDPPVLKAAVAPLATTAFLNLQPSVAELKQLLERAGAHHNIDADLLASLVHAESGGHARAVSRTGARGLMQLMPGTAARMGVRDAFIPDQNVEGGTLYFDQMLTRYHDNIALALAAYNAGPGAVDRYRGVPPFRETRAYVARVIREFNRRKTLLVASSR